MAHAFADIEDTDPQADWSLPGWLYTDPEYFQVEMDRVIRPSWQIVCHESQIVQPGDFHTIDYAGESVIVMRGDDGTVRAFANVCRHRAMRLVEGPAGCAKKLVCPYHAWTYGDRRPADRRADACRLSGAAAGGQAVWRRSRSRSGAGSCSCGWKATAARRSRR